MANSPLTHISHLDCQCIREWENGFWRRPEGRGGIFPIGYIYTFKNLVSSWWFLQWHQLQLWCVWYLKKIKQSLQILHCVISDIENTASTWYFFLRRLRVDFKDSDLFYISFFSVQCLADGAASRKGLPKWRNKRLAFRLPSPICSMLLFKMGWFWNVSSFL